MELKKYLAELIDPQKAVAISKLARLSDLPSAEAEEFHQAWGEVAVEKRRYIIDNLITLAEDDIDLNFDNIFIACLKDPDEVVRLKAIEGLNECELPSLISLLAELLDEDESETVRAAAAGALGKFALLSELRKLKSCHANKVETALFTIIEDESQPIEVRRRAIEAISPLSRPEVRGIIEEAYSSPYIPLRVSAIYAMGQNCDPYWLPTLIKELSNPFPELRYEAAYACGELEERAAVPSLLQLLQDEDIQVKQATIYALGKIGGNQAKEALLKCLQSGEEYIQQCAQEALQELEALEK